MKKYTQITIFLGLFFLPVFVKNARGSDNAQPVVGINSNDTTQPTDNTTNSSQNTNSGQNNPSPSPQQTQQSAGNYKDGSYTGSTEDAYYGNIQVQVTISGGKISDVQFLQSPNDNRTSMMINMQAMPMLKQEAIQAQSANVDIVSGASDSSAAFQKSLDTALKQAS